MVRTRPHGPVTVVALLAACLLVAAVLGVAPTPTPAAAATPPTDQATGGAIAGQPPAAPSAGCGSSAIGAGDTTVTTTSSAVARTYIRHVPPAHDGTAPVPLVIALHGLAEGAVIHQSMTEYAARADAHGFVVAYPQALGSPATWNVAAGSADTTFVTDVLDELEATLCLDTNRIYISGFSLGAFLTSTLMCSTDLADRVAAVAPVAGLRNPAGCAPTRRVPAITFHGTADTWVPFASTPGNVAAWAGRNGCAPAPTSTPLPGDATVTIDHLVYPCPHDGDVELYRITGGGHAWPGSPFSRAIAAAVGYTTFAISATDLIWDFFAAHPLPAAPGSIHGTVTGPSGTAVAGTQAWAYGPDDGWIPTATGIVAADGSYAIDGLPAEDYRVLFVPQPGSGLRPEWFDSSPRSASTPVHVTTGGPAPAVDAELDAAASITGTVTATGGAPVAGVQVWAYAPGDGWVGTAMAVTDAAGHYTIDGLPAGTFAIRFAPIGLPFSTEWFDDAASRATAVPVTTSLGGPPASADATLAAA